MNDIQVFNSPEFGEITNSGGLTGNHISLGLMLLKHLDIKEGQKLFKIM